MYKHAKHFDGERELRKQDAYFKGSRNRTNDKPSQDSKDRTVKLIESIERKRKRKDRSMSGKWKRRKEKRLSA